MFLNFKGKHLCWSLQACRPAKETPTKIFFLWNLRNFYEHLFWRSSCFLVTLWNIYLAETHTSANLFRVFSLIYGKSSNKSPGRLLNFEDYRRGVYWRKAFIKFFAEKKFYNSIKEVTTIFRLFLHRYQWYWFSHLHLLYQSQ